MEVYTIQLHTYVHNSFCSHNPVITTLHNPPSTPFHTSLHQSLQQLIHLFDVGLL